MKLKYKIKRFFSRFKYQKGDLVKFDVNGREFYVVARIKQCTFDLNNRKIYLVEIGNWHEYVAEEDIIKNFN